MYDPKKHLTKYIIDYCRDFMTDEERLTCDYLLYKEYPTDNYKVKFIKNKLGLTPKIEEAIEALLETKTKEQFYEELVARIVKDHNSELNRCPKCNEITRTNKAKQCRFCSHDWH